MKYLDRQILKQLTGLTPGQTLIVPGTAITKSIKKLWDQGLFSDIKVFSTHIDSGKIYLEYYLQERPRLSRIEFKGIRKNEKADLEEKINVMAGSQVTQNLINTTTKIIKDHFT